jgi:hypothetical protein
VGQVECNPIILSKKMEKMMREGVLALISPAKRANFLILFSVFYKVFYIFA